MWKTNLCGLLLLLLVVACGFCSALPATAEETKAADSPQENREKLRHHASAGLAALNIYSTFGCLGLTAELYEAKKFDAAKVDQVTDDVVKTCDLAIELLKNARADEGEAGAEVPYEDLIKCYYLLDREARLLNDAVDSGDKAKLQHFHQAREETWDKVQEVLGIDDEKCLEGETAMMRIFWITVIILAACTICTMTKSMLAEPILGRAGGGLSHWGTRPTPLPIRPIQPIRPIRPIHPIYPWNPWYGTNIVVGPTYGVPNYYYPPTRWDNGQWDGQTRNVQPQPEPKPPKPPERPRVMEWNAATGKAEVYDLDRWDQSQPKETSKAPIPPPTSTEGTDELRRWDE